MNEALFPSLNEPLRDELIHAEVQALMRRLVEAGADPREVADATMATASALMLDVSGPALTATHLMRVGATLAQVSPELREASAQFAAVLGSIQAHLSRPGTAGAEARH